MITRSHSLKAIASIALVVMTCIGLAGCGGGGGGGGGGSRPATGGSGDQMTIEPRPSQDRPDLAVGSPSVSDSNPAAGATFTLSATVRNGGAGASPATTLRYYRSTDATITTSDTSVGTEAVAGLAASGSGSKSVDLTAPASPGTYYYGACVDAVAGESNTTNNCSSSVQVTVNDKPDHSDMPAGATAIALSESFQGRIDSPNDVDYFRLRVDSPGTLTIRTTGNADPDIAVFDGAGIEVPGVSGSWIGSITQEILDRGSDLRVRFSGGNAGGEYTGSATLDQLSQTSPDLSVGSPSVSDSSPAAGASFTLSATVSNTGDGESVATTLRYYRSTDATITPSDTEVDTEAVAELAASGSSSGSVDLTAPASPGTYYYGACVDAVTGESDTTNNCSASVQVVVETQQQLQGQPDLVVALPSVSDSSPAAGASFTLSATVRNDGDGTSAATTLRYYRSTDATITTSDTSVGTGAVAGLAASGSGSESVDLTAPSNPGTYYYGACVDTVAGESDTTNNCSSSVTVVVAGPDLVVASPSVSDSSLAAGAGFTLSATVRNDGDGDAPATTLRYYRSTDATITTSDTSVGTDAVAELSASATSDESVGLTAPSSPGTYYYGACVAAVAGESDTSNNCSSSVAVNVLDPQLPVVNEPDLVVASPSVSDNGPAAGASVTLSATVRNDGDGDSPATTLRYYRSTDATITTSDTAEGTDAVGALSVSGTSAESISVTAPSSPGTYYYGACVVTVTDESDTTNNCSSSVQVTVPQPVYPDLEVGSPSVSDSNPGPGGSFTLSATVSNPGDGESPATTLRYYRSTDATITTSDTAEGTDAVGALSVLGTSAESISVTAPSSPGTYYYGACVDTVTDESDTTNNCSSSVQVTVPQPVYPDLEVGSPSVSDSNPGPGGSFTLSATVSNPGDGESPATTLRYYRSTDATITTSDTSVGTDAVGSLSASGSSAESISLTAPSSADTYYYGACVDTVTDESDTTNNCSSSVQVTVPQPPDLRIQTIAAPSSITVGESFNLSVTVLNDGDGESPATTLRYYRSTDATITSSDTAVGTDAVGALSASGTSAQSISLTAPSSADTYYYGACVDTVTDESDTTNNCSSSAQVIVEERQQQQQGNPDLEVGAPSVSDSSPPAGMNFTLSATVSNTGDGESPATTLRYYESTDATITTSDREVGTDAIAELAASGTSEQSASPEARLSAGTYYYGACVDTVTDESDTTNNCSASVQVTVAAAARVEVTPNPVSLDAVGATATLTGTLFDTNGEEMQPQSWGWSSEDETVATVSGSFFTTGSATVTAIGPGTTTVTYGANGVEGTVTVTVAVTGARVEISPRKLTFEALGDTKSVTVRVLDENGDEDEDASFGYIGVFSPCCRPNLADPPKYIDIERTDEGLEITAEGPGSGSYTISSPGVASAILLVTVYMKPASLEVSPNSVSLDVDETTTLSATIKDANGHSIHVNQGDGQGGLAVYWETSDDQVATVEGNTAGADRNTGGTATVTAVGAGTATITGRWGGSSTVTGTATVTVTDSN